MQAHGDPRFGNLWPPGRRSFAATVLGLVVLVTACAAPPVRVDEEPAAEPDAGLTLRIALTSGSLGPAIAVRWTWVEPDGLDDEVTFLFPEAWAGREGLMRNIRSMEATDLEGNELETELDGSRLTVETEGEDAVVLEYRVTPAAPDLVEATRFLPLLDDRRFFAPGAAFIAQPLGAPAPSLRRIALQLDAHAAGWQPGTTLPDAPAYPIRDLIDAAYFAGAFESVVAVSGPQRVELWGESRLVSILDRVANLALSVIDSQAELLGDDAAALTRIVVLERDDDGEITGTGREGGFVLEVPPTRNLASDRIIAVLAHENLHRLIGHTLTFGGDDEIATLWFREGVTDYLSIRLSIDAGIADSTALFASIVRAWTNYEANPAASLPRDAFVAAYWSNGDHRRLPYDLGALMALVLDYELRRQGAGSLLGFVAFLRDDPGARAAPLTNAALGDALERYAGIGLRDLIDRHVLGGQAPPVVEVLEAMGLEVIERMQPASYFGMRAAATGDGTWVVREVVADSPAARSGVREGMVLAEAPLEEGPVEAPILRLRIVEDGVTRTLSIRGELGQRRTHAVVESPDGSTHREALGLP